METGTLEDGEVELGEVMNESIEFALLGVEALLVGDRGDGRESRELLSKDSGCKKMVSIWLIVYYEEGYSLCKSRMCKFMM